MALERGKPILAINWWLVHGPPRSGTSYLTQMIAHGARRCLGDWGLDPIEIATNRLGRFDKRRALAELVREGER